MQLLISKLKEKTGDLEKQSAVKQLENEKLFDQKAEMDEKNNMLT